MYLLNRRLGYKILNSWTSRISTIIFVWHGLIILKKNGDVLVGTGPSGSQDVKNLEPHPITTTAPRKNQTDLKFSIQFPMKFLSQAHLQ